MGMSWFGRVALAGGWCVALALAGCAGRLADAGAGAGADGGAASLAQDGRQAIGGAQSPVGGELDAHGCLPAAGYTFSVVRNGCIRVFESGVAVVDPGARPGVFVVCGVRDGRGAGGSVFAGCVRFAGAGAAGAYLVGRGVFVVAGAGRVGVVCVLPVRRIRKTVRACGEAVRFCGDLLRAGRQRVAGGR